MAKKARGFVARAAAGSGGRRVGPVTVDRRVQGRPRDTRRALGYNEVLPHAGDVPAPPEVRVDPNQMTLPSNQNAAAPAAAGRVPILVAAALYLGGLTRWPLWEDELWSWGLGKYSFGKMLTLVGRDKHPPLYYATEWALGSLGADDFVLRLPSALAAIGCVALASATARRLVDARAGLLVGTLLALSPFLLAYAWMARGYAWMAFLGAALLWASAALAEGPRPARAAVVLGVAAAAGLYVHYAMAAAIGAAAIGTVTALWWRSDPLPDRARRTAMAAAALALAGLSFVPWALGPFREQLGNQGSAAMNWRVLAYLLWPVDEMVTLTAWARLALAAVGLVWIVGRGRGALRGLMLGWSLAAIVLPILASSTPMALWKLYIYAPFLPGFALLAALGLAWVADGVVRRLSAPTGSVALALVIAAIEIGPLVEVASLPSGPFGRLVSAGGTYDPRVDVAVLRATLTDFNPREVDNREFGPYERYAPDRVRMPDQTGRSPWRSDRRWRTVDPASFREEPAYPGCVFRHAFLLVVRVEPAESCSDVFAEVARVGDETSYGPYLLEMADRAWRAGETADAIRLARRATENLGRSVDGHVFLARRLNEAQLYAEATAVVEEALSRALTWGDRSGAATLWGIQADVDAAQGATSRVAALRARETCAQETDAPLFSCGTAFESVFPTSNAAPAGRERPGPMTTESIPR